MLTPKERRERLPHRAVTIVALTEGCQASDVSRVLSGKTRNDRIECLLSAAMFPTTSQEEAFGPSVPASAHVAAGFVEVDGAPVLLTEEDMREVRARSDAGETVEQVREDIARRRMAARG